MDTGAPLEEEGGDTSRGMTTPEGGATPNMSYEEHIIAMRCHMHVLHET